MHRAQLGASGRRPDHRFPRHRRHCCCPPARRHQLQASITKAVNSFFIITFHISIIVHIAQLGASGRCLDHRFPCHRRRCCCPPARRRQLQASIMGVYSFFMITIRIIRIIRTRRTRITRITRSIRITRIIRTHRKRRILRAPSTAHTPSPGR